MSLVAGNVTGGGGKATTTKTYWHQVLRGTKQDVQTFWVLTGNGYAAYLFRNTKSAIKRVHVMIANLI